MLSLSSLVLSSPLGIVDPCSPRCSPGEQCENGICVKSCPAGSVLVDGPSGTLICKLALNSKCGRTEDCAESKLMNCDTSPTGQFRCKSKPGGFCFDQTDCSIMITGKPLCSENFCKRVLNLGDTGCSSDSTKKICDKGLKCVGDTCRSPIDGPCEKTSNCDPTSGKSTCEFNVCKSLPGGPCSSDSQCEKSWDTLNPSKCVDGTCKATLNFLNTGCSDSNYVCGLGLKCFNDTCLSTLKLGNTGCSDSNKICDIGLKCFENKCISTLNGYCSQTSDCDQTSGASNCDKNVCKLLPGGLCSNDSQCDKSRYPSNTCNTNSGFCMSSCTSNSDCYAPPNSKYSALCLSSKFCRIIPTEYNCKTFLGSRNTKSVQINGRCACPGDCVSGSTCYDYTGAVTPAYFLSGIRNGTCLKRGSIGSGCSKTSDCSSKGAICLYVNYSFAQEVLSKSVEGLVGKCVNAAVENGICNLNPVGLKANTGCQSGYSCSDAFGYNGFGNCLSNTMEAGNGCILNSDCSSSAKCVNKIWQNAEIPTLRNINSWIGSKCLLITGNLNDDCNYAYDDSISANKGCNDGLICSGIKGIALQGKCKIAANLECENSDQCVSGTNCYDSSGKITTKAGFCKLSLGKVCMETSHCFTGSSCVFSSSLGQVILDSPKFDPNKRLLLLGNCVILANSGTSCNYKSTGSVNAFTGCEFPLNCYNGSKIAFSGKCSPYIANVNQKPFNSSLLETPVSSSSRLKKRVDYIFPRLKFFPIMRNIFFLIYKGLAPVVGNYVSNEILSFLYDPNLPIIQNNLRASNLLTNYREYTLEDTREDTGEEFFDEDDPMLEDFPDEEEIIIPEMQPNVAIQDDVLAFEIEDPVAPEQIFDDAVVTTALKAIPVFGIPVEIGLGVAAGLSRNGQDNGTDNSCDINKKCEPETDKLGCIFGDDGKGRCGDLGPIHSTCSVASNKGCQKGLSCSDSEGKPSPEGHCLADKGSECYSKSDCNSGLSCATEGVWDTVISGKRGICVTLGDIGSTCNNTQLLGCKYPLWCFDDSGKDAPVGHCFIMLGGTCTGLSGCRPGTSCFASNGLKVSASNPGKCIALKASGVSCNYDVKNTGCQKGLSCSVVSGSSSGKCVTLNSVGVPCNWKENTGCQSPHLNCFDSKGVKSPNGGTCLKDFSVACKNSTECRFGLGCDPKSKGCSILFGVSCSLNTDCITVSKIENPSYAGSGCLLAKDYFNRPTSVKKPDGKVCVYLLKKGSQCSTTAQYSTVSNFYKCGQGFKCGASSGVCE